MAYYLLFQVCGSILHWYLEAFFYQVVSTNYLEMAGTQTGSRLSVLLACKLDQGTVVQSAAAHSHTLV